MSKRVGKTKLLIVHSAALSVLVRKQVFLPNIGSMNIMKTK